MQLIYRSEERHKVSELRLKTCADNRNIIYKAPFNPILPGLLNTLQTWGGGVFYPPS